MLSSIGVLRRLVAGSAILGAFLAVCPGAPWSAAKAGAEVFPQSMSYKADLGSPEGFPLELRTEGQTVELAIVQDDPRGRLSGGQFVALYSTGGQVGEKGIHASFGALGEIDLRFLPSSNATPQILEVPELPDHPAPSCAGKKPVLLKGRLQGTLDFEGAEDYVQVDRSSVPAEFTRSFRETCTYGRSRPTTMFSPRRWGGGWAHTVIAQMKEPHREVFFMNEALTRHEGHESSTSSLDAGFLEFHEGVRLLEHIFFDARTHFRLHKPAGGRRRVMLAPPPPFSGNATFTRLSRHARPRWGGSLRISLPGAPDVALTGHGFKADLCGNNEERCSNEFYR